MTGGVGFCTGGFGTGGFGFGFGFVGTGGFGFVGTGGFGFVGTGGLGFVGTGVFGSDFWEEFPDEVTLFSLDKEGLALFSFWAKEFCADELEPFELVELGSFLTQPAPEIVIIMQIKTATNFFIVNSPRN
ncbi:MAG: hypothetical protein RSA99_05550, partial [Oscillospiraceae bacterium]